MTTNILTATGVDSDFFFPGIRGGAFTVLQTDQDIFRIQYAMDGNPGQELIVEFVSAAGAPGDFTYSGSIPTAGTFTTVNLFASDGTTQLGEFIGSVTALLTNFDLATLPDTLLTGAPTHTGNAGDDTLHSFEAEAVFVGNGGSDTFVVDGSDTAISSTFHGSASDGSGGAGETNTIVLATDGTGFAQIDLSAGNVTNIDALTFDRLNNSTFFINFAPSVGTLSPTAAITGDAHVNTLDFRNLGGSIDLSGFSFNTWTAGEDDVIINTQGSSGTYTGSVVDDDFNTIADNSTVVGLTGDDTFSLNTKNPTNLTIHGSAADGSGGAGETDLLALGSAEYDLRSGLTVTNIDGIQSSTSSNLDVVFSTGAEQFFFDSIRFDASQLGSGFSSNFVVRNTGGGQVGLVFTIDTLGGTLDASLWDISGLSNQGSDLHVTGTTGDDTITGWAYDDIVVLGGGADTVSTGGGNDFVFLDETASGGSLDGGAGSDTLVMNLTASTSPFSFTLLEPAQTSTGPGGMSIRGFEDLRFFGGSDADTITLTGNEFEGSHLLGGDGADTFIIDGTDTFVFDMQFHGGFFAGNGTSSVADLATDEIILRTADGTVRLSGGQVTDIDALTFDATGDSRFLVVGFAPSASTLSMTATITGDAHQNRLQFENPGNIDLSGFNFVNWTAGTDSVEIFIPGSNGMFIGSSENDVFQSVSGSTTTLVGGAGDDIFELVNSNFTGQIHGSAADGSGGGAETDLIASGANVLDLTLFNFSNLTNIDGFAATGGRISFVEQATGEFFPGFSGSRIFAANASQFGGDIASNLLVQGDGTQTAAFAITIDTLGGTFDASTWQTPDVGLGSQIHVAGTTGNDTITGWAFDDIVVLNGGTDTVSLGDGRDRVFMDSSVTGGNLDGGAGSDDLLIIDWRSETSGLTLEITDPSAVTVGPNGVSITGFEGISFFGGSGDDTIRSPGVQHDFNISFNMILEGGDGNDVLDAGIGSEAQLRGGDGDDTLISSGVGGNISGGDGIDFAIVDRSANSASTTIDLETFFNIFPDGTDFSSIERLEYTAGNGNDNISGGALNDVLRGNGGRDLLSGRGGDDMLFGGDGLDIIDGGDGNDMIDAGASIDLIDGGAGDDDINGGDSADTIDGGADNDTIDGGAGADNLSGGAGDDTLIFDAQDVSIDGGSGTDTGDASAETADLTIDMEATNLERLIAGSGNDTITGTAGDDIIEGGAGADTIDGRGHLTRGDTAAYSMSDAGVTVDLLRGTHSGGHATGDVLIGIENLYGSTFDDDLNGDDSDNMLTGGLGSDRISGSGGDDHIVLADSVAGDLDIIAGDIGTDAVDFSQFASAVWVDLEYTGAVDIWTRDGADLNSGTWRPLAMVNTVEGFIGSAFDDDLRGDLNDNQFFYTGGQDEFDGRAGDGDLASFDLFGSAVWVDLEYGSFYEAWTRDGADVNSGTWRAIASVENIENLEGTQFSDELFGNSQNNTFSYTGGQDEFDGRLGTDTGTFENFGSAVWVNLSYGGFYEAYTRDGTDVNSGTWRAIASLEDIENVAGSAFDDKLFGNASVNELNGNAGNDELTGFGALDRFTFDIEWGMDTITDFDSNGEIIDLSAHGTSFGGLDINQVGNDTVINITGDLANTITLTNVMSGTIDMTDFDFV